MAGGRMEDYFDINRIDNSDSLLPSLPSIMSTFDHRYIPTMHHYQLEQLIETLISIRKNNREVEELVYRGGNTHDQNFLVGELLGNSTYVKRLCITGEDFVETYRHSSALFSPMVKNKSIEKIFLHKLTFTNDNNKSMGHSLCSFVSSNENLQHINLNKIHLSSVDAKAFINAIYARRGELITLTVHNCKGPFEDDIDIMNYFLQTVKDCTALQKFKLSHKRPSMTKSYIKYNTDIIGSKHNTINHLELVVPNTDNHSETLQILIDLLDKLIQNDKIETLDTNFIRGRQYQYDIMSPYFKKVIDVLFNSVSMQSLITSSNHYLNSLGYCKLSNQHTDRDFIRMLTWCIGDDKVQLLKWLLHTNLQRNKNIVIQLKTINAHAMGNINLGELNEAPLMMKVHLISYFTVRQMFECVYYKYYDREHHETNEEEIQTARLDATYRIVKELF